MKNSTLLIVDDNKSVLSAIKILMSNIFEHVIVLSNPNAILSTIRENKVNVVLLDMNFGSGVNSGNEGLFWLTEIKKNYPTKCEIVLFTAYADINLAINGMKQGATDFVVKPWDNTQLIKSLKAAYELSQQSVSSFNKQASYTLKQDANRMYWGKSKKMKDLRTLVEKVAVTDANILIIGENGTGKEVLASEIHRLSSRFNSNMVTVDMGAITETLFESEFFGHVKGAFTDAKSDKQSKFEIADNGTLFLDEIGNLPLHLQSKLLTVLQNRKVIRVGGNDPIDFNIRLISATNQNIEEMVDKGDFRIDLMYRLNTITIQLVPLRDRKEDIIDFAMKFIETYKIKYDKKIIDLTPEAKELLQNHYWAGNVRELQHSIEKAIIICNSSLLDVSDFALNNQKSINLNDRQDESTLEEMEKKMISTAIDKYESNLSLVASSLGISRQTLYNKMKKYNL